MLSAVVFVWSLLLATAHCESLWTLVELDSAGKTQVIASRASEQEADPCHHFPHDSQDHVVVTYDHPQHGECHVKRHDPRRMFHDSLEKGALGGGVRQHERITFAVSLHHTTEKVRIVDLKNGAHTSTHHVVAESRGFKQQATFTLDKTKVVNTTLQLTGPSSNQFNLVFLSSGYLASQQSKFDAKVSQLIHFMQFGKGDLSPMPYQRYFSTTNIFKVFYPSNQEGAKHPAPAGDGRAPDNNLDCSYGDTQQRILQCDRSRVELLGSYAPPPSARALYIVMVNDESTFGGTGGSGICNIYTGSKMEVVFIHEVGHAAANLADEYGYGVSETNQIPMPNCAWSNSQPGWKDWILAGLLQNPSPVCTYNNYYKPTAGSCLMESEQNSMCSVCLEHSVKTLFQKGLDLTAPMYPMPVETLMLPLGSVAVLQINKEISTYRDVSGGFSVSWRDSSNVVVASGVSKIAFAPAAGALPSGVTQRAVYSSPGSYQVTVTVQDDTVLLLAATRQALTAGNNITSLRQQRTFRITVYDPAVTTNVDCVERNHSGTAYCARCDPGQESVCDQVSTHVPLEQVTDLNSELSKVKSWLIIVGVVFLVIGIIAFIVIWWTMSMHNNSRVAELLPLSFPVQLARVALMVLQIVLLVGCTVVIVFAIYMYDYLSVFGRSIVLGIIFVAVIVWFTSFIGFAAAYYKNRHVLFADFALLLILFGCCALFTFLLVYVLVGIESQGVYNQLHEEWQTAIRDDPATVCALQKELDCSGYNTSCVTLSHTQGTSDCPAQCESGNRIGFPCRRRITDFVEENFGLAAAAGGGLCVFVVICMALALVLGCNIKTNKVKTWDRRRQRYIAGENALTDEEIRMLKKEFRKIDRDGSGDISREEFSTFYNEVMGANLNPRQLEEYFDKLDTDHSGTLSFEEFVHVYDPPKARPDQEAPMSPGARTFVYAAAEQTIAGKTASDAYDPEDPNCTVSAQEQQRNGALELVLDDTADIAIEDEHNTAQLAHASAAQEARAKQQQLAVTNAHAARQQRMALERPQHVDVNIVLDELSPDLGGEQDIDDFEQINLELDWDKTKAHE